LHCDLHSQIGRPGNNKWSTGAGVVGNVLAENPAQARGNKAKTVKWTKKLHRVW